jgi:anaphase-promoting complex subunit 6
MLSNHIQADEALSAANRLCADDPLLANEQGVMEFNHGEFVLSLCFRCALGL